MLVGGLIIPMACLTLAAAAVDQDSEPARAPEPVRIEPLPDHGPVPPCADFSDLPTEDELEFRAEFRGYEKQLKAIRRHHFRNGTAESVRTRGIAQMREFTDPASFRPMILTMRGESDDVRLAMLDHFTALGETGQAGLAWTAILSGDDDLSYEATRRITTPPARPVLRVLDVALRSEHDAVANNAGRLAGAVNAFEVVPLLIFAQARQGSGAATGTADRSQGDLAWIAIQKQTAYVQRVEPVVGSGAGAFRPIMGVVTEGVILRAVDAVVVVYRTDVHRSLVGLTTRRMGETTEDLGYDMGRWWGWYNDRYVPEVNRRADLAARAAPPEEAEDP